MESADNQTPSSSAQGSEAISPPLSKTETIALLNDSIDQLEETIRKISEDSAKIPSSDSINSLLTTTQALAKAVTPKQVKAIKPEVTPAKKTKVSNPFVTKDVTNVGTSKNVQTSTSPAAKKKNLGLIVIAVTAIAIAIVTVFWLWKPQIISNLFSQDQPTPIKVPTEVSTEVPKDLAPSPQQPPTTPLIKTPEAKLDQVDQVNNLAQDSPTPINPVTKPLENTEDPEDLAEAITTSIPPELTSPGKPKNLKMVTIKPELNFTPEQNLLATLTTKLDQLAQDYPREFIQDIQVNLPAESLLVQVTDDWYGLDESAQNNLGNEILERARAFSFKQLEVKDQVGTLVARNPIIGEEIIIVQAKK